MNEQESIEIPTSETKPRTAYFAGLAFFVAVSVIATVWSLAVLALSK